jgi:glycosyltransferase involved in cell wall biosynthesis
MKPGMKICIPAIEQEQGGSGTFRRAWRAWLSRQGVAWTDDISADYDVLFVNAWQSRYRAVYQQKKRLPTLRVIHRVDGAGRDYGRTDGADALQGAVNALADVTIFQSDYCRQSTMNKFHIIGLDGPIIYNPVDAEFFSPEGDTLPEITSIKGPRILTAIWSPNPRKGAWRIPGLARANPNANFIFVGQAAFDDPPPNVHRFDAMERAQLAAAMRSCDVFLNLSENDPCPNIVIEAMASGLPVIFVPTGGTPELVGEAGLPIHSDTDFPQRFERIMSNLPQYQKMARERAVSEFEQDRIFAQYLAAIEASQRRDMPSLRRHVLAHGQSSRQWLRDKIVNYQDWMPFV